MSGTSRVRGWRGYVGLSVAWLAILGATLLATRRPSSQPIEIVPPPAPPATETPIPSPTPSPLRVDVAGAVRAPGVYTLPPGSIVAEAIAAAGGPAGDADLDRVNKALPLQDGTQVYVPHQAETAPPLLVNAVTPPAAPAAASQPRAVDLNTATAQELEALPGIGPALAQRIIDARPYATVEDLLKVKGIGDAIFAKIKDQVIVR